MASVDPTILGGEAVVGAPKIAVVVSLWFPGMGGESHQLMTDFTRQGFESVRAAGGDPFLVDSSADPKPDIEHFLAKADGVLFLGGGDVDPALYGGDVNAPNMYGVDRAADDFCVAALRQAIEQDMTLLAICRGSQLLNVACGGTLIPDLQPYQLHRGGPGQPTFLDEEVLLTSGSRVQNIFCRDRITVRSGHHQAVAEVAPSLRVAALAADGVVEGTEHRERDWVVGMQWHPEDPDADPHHRRLLFEAFIGSVKSRVSGIDTHE